MKKRISENAKVTLTLKQLRRLVKESIDDEDVSFDISRAISSGNYKFEGINDSPTHQRLKKQDYRHWGGSITGGKPTKAGDPSVVNAKMFGLVLYQKSDRGWLNLHMYFDMGSAFLKLYDGAEKRERPWEDRRKGIPGFEPKKISDNLLDEVKSGSALNDLLEEWIEQQAPNVADQKKADMHRKLARIGNEQWNGYCDSFNAERSKKDGLKDAVEYCKATYPFITGGGCTKYYDRGGPGDSLDYDGEYTLSLNEVFELFGITSVEAVDRVADAIVNLVKSGKNPPSNTLSKRVIDRNFQYNYGIEYDAAAVK